MTGHTLQPELAGRHRLLRKLGRVRRSRGAAGVAPRPAPCLRPHPTGLLGRDRGGSGGARKAPPRPPTTSTAVLEPFRQPGASCTTVANLRWSPPSPAATCGRRGGSARSLRRVRRLASAGARGLTDPHLSLVPGHGRLHPLLGYIPLGVARAAALSVRACQHRTSADGHHSGSGRGRRLVARLNRALAGTVTLHLIRHGEVVQSTATSLLAGGAVVGEELVPGTIQPAFAAGRPWASCLGGVIRGHLSRLVEGAERRPDPSWP